jgi:AcrR family transcriptional regulator
LRNIKAGRYHHGDLRAALIDTAVELIGERGVQGFSLAEASRRLGVTVAAPYKHFADRDQLLAAVAVRASGILAAAVAAETAGALGAADRLVAAACGYVRCAASNRALFLALFGAGLDKSRHPEIEQAAKPVADAFLAPARTICGHPDEAYDLTLAVVAAAHGHASLLLDGAFGNGQEAIDAATHRAANVTRAIIHGRKELHSSTTRRSE